MSLHKRFAFIINFLYIAILCLLGYVTLKYALPMVMPFALGFAVAYLMRRPALFLSRLLHIPSKYIALALVLLFFSTIGLLLTLLGIRIFSYIKLLVLGFPDLYSAHIEPVLLGLSQLIESRIERLDPTAVATINELLDQAIGSIGSAVSGLSMSVMSLISGSAASLPSFFIKLLLFIISALFIAVDYEPLTAFCMRQMSGNGGKLFLQIKEYVVGTLFVCIRSYALIMSITFIELTIGFTIIRLDSAPFIAFLIALFDILPVLGTGGIMLPWAVLTAFGGNIPLAFSLFIIYLAVTVVRNIIEPKIVGSQIGLHPVVTLVSMFVGAQLFGVLGLFGFPIGLSLLRYLNETGEIRIFK